MTSRLHSADTLCYGVAEVKQGNGDPSSRKRELEEKIKEPSWHYNVATFDFAIFERVHTIHVTMNLQIEASQERIASLRRKLSNQATGACPEPSVPGFSSANV